MKYVYFILTALLIAGCNDSPEETGSDKTNGEDSVAEMTTDELIVRKIESALSIPATENYTYKVYREHLNGDDSLDYIISVNRLEKALNDAIESGQVAKRAEIGYMGNFNYFFYMDGSSKAMTTPIPVPSSPHAELRVTFDNIVTEGYKDVMVDFRIRNSCFRRFYTVVGETPRQDFEMKIYDGLGTDDREAYVMEYEPGTYSLAKDILIYKANLEAIEITDPMEVYSLDPEITKTDVLDRRWFFNGNETKYFTEK